MCLRCSPGLFRHSCGAVSCHTSSMAANPQLALTKNSSPTTLANGRRAAQNRGVQGQRPRSPVATGEIPARRSGRNTRAAHGAKSPIVQSAIRRWRNPRGACRKAAVPTPSAGGGRRPYFVPLIDGAVCRPVHLLWTSAPTGCNTSFVGRGIPDAPTMPPTRGRQGCRPLRFVCSVVRISGGTHRSRPTLPVGSLSGFVGHCANWFPMQSLFCVSCIK